MLSVHIFVVGRFLIWNMLFGRIPSHKIHCGAEGLQLKMPPPPTSLQVLFLRLSTGKMHGSRVKLSRPQRLVTNGPRSHVGTLDRHTVLLWTHTAADVATAEHQPQRPLRLTHTKQFTVGGLGSGEGGGGGGKAGCVGLGPV